jgi:cytidylate kinase
MIGRFITVHGIDGTGKTTLSNELAASLSLQGEPTIHANEVANNITNLPYTTPDYENYPQANSLQKKLGQSAILLSVIAEGITVVRDRWLIDICANSRYLDEKLPSVFPEILIPNISILLRCDEIERQGRIQSRSNPTSDDLVPNEPGTRAHFFEQYLINHIGDYSYTNIMVNTSCKSIGEVTNAVLTGIAK